MSYMQSIERVPLNEICIEPYQRILNNARVKRIAGKERFAFDAEGKPFSKMKQYQLRDAIFEAIFDRFYKGSDSSTHSGLGLTLVKAICDSYLLEINYQYKEGHIFTVSKKI